VLKIDGRKASKISSSNSISILYYSTRKEGNTPCSSCAENHPEIICRYSGNDAALKSALGRRMKEYKDTVARFQSPFVCLSREEAVQGKVWVEKLVDARLEDQGASKEMRVEARMPRMSCISVLHEGLLCLLCKGTAKKHGTRVPRGFLA
jgi:hypothetical protein